MRKLFLIFLLLQTSFIFSQQNNRFDFSLAANYPFNNSSTDLSRQLGFDIGFDYSRLLFNKVFVKTGVHGDFYSEYINDRKSTANIFIPLQAGYSFEKIEISLGIFLGVADFTKKNTYDPELNYIPTYDGPYYDTNPYTKMGRLGLDLTLDYRFNKHIYTFFNLRRINYSHHYLQNTDYSYLVTNIGLKYRL